MPSKKQLTKNRRIMFRARVGGELCDVTHLSIWEATIGAHLASLRGLTFAIERVDGEPLNAWQQRAFDACISARSASYARSAA